MPGRIGRSRLPWALVSLALGYVSLVAGPLWNARGSLSTWLSDFASGASGLPQPLAIGVALFGAAALVLVVARQVRDVDLHPYASIAPVLAVFSGLVLSSVRAQLPFPDVSGPQLGLAALAIALLGGALIGRTELGARALGWGLAALPSIALALALAAVRGEGDPLAMVRNVDAPLRAYLALLAISSLALALVGNFAGSLARKQTVTAPALRLAPHANTPVDLRVPVQMRPPPLRQTMPQYDSPAAFAASYMPGSFAQYAPTALALDDPDLLALTRRRPLANLAWFAAASLALAAVGGYFMVIKPEQERVAAVERARSLKAAQARASAAASEESGTDALADRMARYLSEREQERAGAQPLAIQPVVTPLSAPAAQPALAPRVEAKPEQAKPERHHHHHRVRSEPTPKPAAAKLDRPAPAAKPEPAKVAPAKPAPKTQNERELDLDELVQKALKGGKQSAADDPILGL